MKKILFTFCASLIALSLSAISFAEQNKFEKTKIYNENFTDVNQSDWYSESVTAVYELGLMEGVATDRFDADSTLTVAQGVTLAARLNSIYTGKEIDDAENAKNWYDKYVLYAIDNKIIGVDDFSDYGAVIKSYQMALLLAHSLPEDYFTAINNVDIIPDVTESLPYYKEVSLLYKAGILNGNDEYGTFYPESPLTRKRAAAIIARTALSDLRVNFTLKQPNASYSLDELLDIVNSMTQPETLDEFTMVTIDDFDFSVAEYRYYYAMLSDIYKGDELKSQTLDNLSIRAAAAKLAKQNNVCLPFENLRDFYSSYYILRYNYGDNYSTILNIYHTTDRALCRDEIMSRIRSYQLTTLFGENAPHGYTKQEVTDYAIKADYICAKHILISNNTENAKERAQEVLERVNSGEDFDALIRQCGQDPTMAQNPNGYYFTKGTMVEPFEKTAYSLNPGEVSGIVESVYGYHIIKRCEFNQTDFENSSFYTSIANTISQNKALEYYKSVSEGLNITYAAAFNEFLKLLD